MSDLAKRSHRRGGQQFSQRKPTSVNPLKKKIRDLTRLLAKADSMPADVKMENERALSAFKLELREAEHHAKEQKLSKKYHMVKFVERQKATRKLRKAETKLSEAREQAVTGSELEKIEQEREEAEVDLNYTIYYPRDQKYISLFANQDAEGKSGTLERPSFWYTVQRQTRDGTLGKEVRPEEQRSKPSADSAPKSKPKSKSKSKATADSRNPKTKDVAELEDADSSDGGGFFEE